MYPRKEVISAIGKLILYLINETNLPSLQVDDHDGGGIALNRLRLRWRLVGCS
jgi:hypothetical protein